MYKWILVTMDADNHEDYIGPFETEEAALNYAGGHIYFFFEAKQLIQPDNE